MDWLKNKKFKYGAVAVALTVAVILLVILFNVIISALSDHFGWYADTSVGGYSTLSEESKALLDEVDGRYHSVTICFLTDEDLLAANAYGGYVLSLAKQMEQQYDFISLEFISDVNKDILEIRNFFGMSYTALFQQMYDDHEITTGTILLRDDTVEFGPDGEPLTDPQGQKIEAVRLDTASIPDLYSVSSGSFLGELALTGRVMRLVSKAPVAALVAGHGEMTTEEDKSYGNADYLAELMTYAGFSLKKTLMRDLASSGALCAVVFAPKTDFTEEETEALAAFVQGGGHLLYFADDTAPKQPLSHLNGLLASYGITVVNAKFQDSGDAAQSVDGYMFAARADETLPTVKAIANRDRRFTVSDCRVLRLTARSGMEAEALLLPSPSTSLWGGVTEADGSEAVAVRVRTAGGQVFATGAASLASSLVFSPTCANGDLLFSVLTDMGAPYAPLNVPTLPLLQDGLDITKTESTVLSVILSVVPALLVVGIGVMILWRRKRA